MILDYNAPLPATIYWDASFIVNFSHADSAFHAESIAFLTRLKESATLSFVSTLALDEAWFAILQAFVSRDYAPRKFWKVYEQDPKIILPYLDRLDVLTNDLYDQPQIRVVGTHRRSPLDALKNMRQFYFLPRDAMHLAVMRQHKITSIVTTDADFQAVAGITVYTCNSSQLAHPSTNR